MVREGREEGEIGENDRKKKEHKFGNLDILLFLSLQGVPERLMVHYKCVLGHRVVTTPE